MPQTDVFSFDFSLDQVRSLSSSIAALFFRDHAQMPDIIQVPRPLGKLAASLRNSSYVLFVVAEPLPSSGVTATFATAIFPAVLLTGSVALRAS